MGKITDLTFTTTTTREFKDSNGNRYRKQVEAEIKRKVKTVSGGKRFLHYLIDAFVYGFIIEVIDTIFNVIGNLIGWNPLLIVFSFLPFGSVYLLSYAMYYFVFEQLFQKTPGKFITKTIVVDEFANKPASQQLILRSLARMVPFEALSCWFNDRGWHDRWTDTFVVSDEELTNLKNLLQEKENQTNNSTEQELY